MVKHILKGCLAILLFQLISCDGVEDIFNGKAPILSDEGLIVSADRVLPKDTVIASIEATNPEKGPLTYEWSTNAGNFIQPADSSTVRWIAPFTGGEYYIKVKVSNEKRSTSDEKKIYVESSEKPLVDITSPSNDSYFILYDQIPVQANAYHENGIAAIRLIVSCNGKDSLIQELDGNSSGEYSFSQLKSYNSIVGQTTLIVEAEARNAQKTKGSDNVVVNIEGIIFGKVAN